MIVFHRIKRFLVSSDGFQVTTERIVLLSLTLCGLVIGLAAVRNAMRDEFLDEVDAVAACTNTFLFGDGVNNGDTYRTRFTDDFAALFPELADPMPNVWPPEALQVERPQPTPASKEAIDQGFGGGGEDPP